VNGFLEIEEMIGLLSFARFLFSLALMSLFSLFEVGQNNEPIETADTSYPKEKIKLS
jgi:hypothetical protein